MKQEDINLLKQLGLTTYEAKAYITLSSLIQATADEISEKSDIPRSKIYDVLKRLNSKDYIKIESGRPLTYHVNPPINVLKREKEKFIRRINKIQRKIPQQCQMPTDCATIQAWCETLPVSFFGKKKHDVRQAYDGKRY